MRSITSPSLCSPLLLLLPLFPLFLPQSSKFQNSSRIRTPLAGLSVYSCMPPLFAFPLPLTGSYAASPFRSHVPNLLPSHSEVLPTPVHGGGSFISPKVPPFSPPTSVAPQPAPHTSTQPLYCLCRPRFTQLALK